MKASVISVTLVCAFAACDVESIVNQINYTGAASLVADGGLLQDAAVTTGVNPTPDSIPQAVNSEMADRLFSAYTNILARQEYGCTFRAHIKGRSVSKMMDHDANQPVIYTTYSVDLQYVLHCAPGEDPPDSVHIPGGVMDGIEYRRGDQGQLSIGGEYIFVTGRDKFRGYTGGGTMGAIEVNSTKPLEIQKVDSLLRTLAE